MARRVKNGVVRKTATEHKRRDQEVVRAKRELAAYFKGRRAELEARAALKIIKPSFGTASARTPEACTRCPALHRPWLQKRTTMRKIEAVRKGAARKARRYLPATQLDVRHETESRSVAKETLPP